MENNNEKKLYTLLVYSENIAGISESDYCRVHSQTSEHRELERIC